MSGALGRDDIERLQDNLGRLNGSITGGVVILDLSGVRRIDSGGMRALSNANSTLAERGVRQIVTGMSGEVREAISIAGVDRILETSDSLDTALADLTKAG